MKHFAIAIDGPAGSGKSTVAQRLSKALQIIYVDTGAMFRTVGLYAARKGVASTDEAGVTALLPEIEITIIQREGVQRIFLNGEDVSEEIRIPAAGQWASDVAVFFAVREKLIVLQRKLAEGTSVVMDGRDIGTCVLPDAELKIYLEADPMERARRRQAEFRLKGREESLEEVYQQILIRDENDKNRVHAPLKKADDAIEVDTTHMTIEEVTEKILSIVSERGLC